MKTPVPLGLDPNLRAATRAGAGRDGRTPTNLPEPAVGRYLETAFPGPVRDTTAGSDVPGPSVSSAADREPLPAGKQA
jgi:hypothetical protein